MIELVWGLSSGIEFFCYSSYAPSEFGPRTALVRDVESIGALLFCNASDIS